MINPILIIGGAAVLLSAAVIAILNKPKLPLIASAFIIVLMFFLVTTFMLDNSIADFSKSESLTSFICFCVMNDTPSYDDLTSSFRAMMYIDMSLFAGSVISMFIEAMFILRKNSDV